MFRRCKHQWVDTGQHYAPPTAMKNVEADGILGEMMLNRMMLGTTIISQRCSVCGEPRTLALLGKFIESGNPGEAAS